VRAVLAAALLALAPASQAAEVCTYAGAASHDARATIRTEASEAGGMLTLRVLARVQAAPWWWSLSYLMEEISTWRGGELQSVALNTRYILDGRVRRQQWDVLARTPEGLQAQRVQSTSLPEFNRRHPRFAGHWDPSRFGQPWLSDYPAAGPERRTDLDLPRAGMPPGLRTPLALMFYWSRFLPPGNEAVPVFLPGWKRDARADEPVAAVSPGRWRMTLRHPAVGAGSWAEAAVSPDHQLLRLTFAVRARVGNGEGWVALEGCTG
jgi:hypothetical protein